MEIQSLLYILGTVYLTLNIIIVLAIIILLFLIIKSYLDIKKKVSGVFAKIEKLIHNPEDVIADLSAAFTRTAIKKIKKLFIRKKEEDE